MTRTDVAAATNARVTPIVEYGVDPRGWRMFAALSGRLQRGLSGRDGTRVLGADDVDGRAFYGYAQAPQHFAGMAPLGQARPYVPATSEISDERAAGALDDAGLRIFAERLRRRR